MLSENRAERNQMEFFRYGGIAGTTRKGNLILMVEKYV